VPETNSEHGEVLTLEEAAAFLRIPAEQVKRALADWLRYGPYYREFQRYGPHWPFEPLEEMFGVMERLSVRLAALEEKIPRRGSKQAVLKHFGVFRDDDDLDARLAEARARRERGSSSIRLCSRRWRLWSLRARGRMHRCGCAELPSCEERTHGRVHRGGSRGPSPAS
jgi:hypothetical protein